MNYCFECATEISARATLCKKCHNKKRTINATNKTLFCIKKDMDYIVEVAKNTANKKEATEVKRMLNSLISKIKFDLDCKNLK